jgi:Na+-transporting NADH:ubiquinone oxidoreductase subunit NqrA
MMADTITIKKGLDIPVAGAAEKRLTRPVSLIA